MPCIWLPWVTRLGCKKRVSYGFTAGKNILPPAGVFLPILSEPLNVKRKKSENTIKFLSWCWARKHILFLIRSTNSTSYEGKRIKIFTKVNVLWYGSAIKRSNSYPSNSRVRRWKTTIRQDNCAENLFYWVWMIYWTTGLKQFARFVQKTRIYSIFWYHRRYRSMTQLWRDAQ